jgi:hypothetical protein
MMAVDKISARKWPKQTNALTMRFCESSTAVQRVVARSPKNWFTSCKQGNPEYFCVW